MSKRVPVGNQAFTLSPYSPFVQISLDPNKQDQFATSFAVDFFHYKAMPSPIGQKDKGDYRRSDGVDTISSNGMLYTLAGTFSATISDNRRTQKWGSGGELDPSEARLILPRFYNDKALADGPRIYLAPGDRVYIKDPNANVFVTNYHKMDYEDDRDNVPMFPICQFDGPIIDSLNREYKQGLDFELTTAGNIRWLASGKNPGIDPETKKGRIYSIRYLYKAYWYVTSLPKEIRMTNVTAGGVRAPERLPYYANIVREFIFHNQNKGDEKNQNVSETPQRAQQPPKETIQPGSPVIPVDMTTILEGDEE